MIFLTFLSKQSYLNKIYNFFHKKIQNTKQKSFPFYSSKSDSGNHIFYAFANHNIWIDLEINKERSLDFLDIFSDKEYQILWEKNWENFYFLWTAKESIIKFERKNLDFLQQIFLEKSHKNQKIISNIKFSHTLKYRFQNNIYYIYSWKNQKTIYSICINFKKAKNE